MSPEMIDLTITCLVLAVLVIAGGAIWIVSRRSKRGSSDDYTGDRF